MRIFQCTCKYIVATSKNSESPEPRVAAGSGENLHPAHGVGFGFVGVKMVPDPCNGCRIREKVRGNMSSCKEESFLGHDIS